MRLRLHSLFSRTATAVPLLVLALLAVPLVAEAQLDVSGRHLVVLRHADRSSDAFAAEVAALGGEVDWLSEAAGLAIVSDLTAGAADLLRSHSDVLEVELERMAPLGGPELAADAADLATEPVAAAMPSDAPVFPMQWHLRSVRADAAWSAGRFGSAAVRVAVLDSGVDYLHPDLVGRVDLASSISLAPDDADLIATFFPGRHEVTDLHGHGTTVSSIIASNAAITAGMTRDTTVIGVKVCQLLPDFSDADCLEGATLAGIVHAVDAGADVINMSISGYGGSFDPVDHPGLKAAINRAFNYAKRHGVTVVVAAGNSAADISHGGRIYTPYCDTPHVVCVSATGPTSGNLFTGPWTDPDSPASYTNRGNQVSVAAPGGNVGFDPVSGPVGGVVWGACTTSQLHPLPVVGLSCPDSPKAAAWVGTSFAAPHVAGLAALLVEDFGRNPGRIAARLRGSATDLGDPGEDPVYGAGRIDAAAALEID